MNEEDLSDIMKKITNMINSNNSEVSSDLDNSSNEKNSNEANDFNSSNTNTNTNFNIDIATLLKVKSVMDKMNSNQNNPRTNLLLSLKPYLKPSRKDKVDQYIKLLNMEHILEIFRQEEDNNGGDTK